MFDGPITQIDIIRSSEHDDHEVSSDLITEEKRRRLVQEWKKKQTGQSGWRARALRASLARGWQ